ncbi:MAG: type II CRISPR RNA-guided endonuclease Cas9 [Oscillospiraceae bacterium]|nr:type II CRISPR RNA-guided endonuclease Cas9 [Oscillospiraceae bacterium]
MRYSIGLDIGIASVGFAVMELDEDDSPISVVRVGSRVFDVAENPKDGASLALPRREARGARRRVRRRKHRKDRIRNLIINHGVLSKDQLETLYKNQLSDIYQIRKEALERLITNEELARILIHLAQRRGFKSNRKTAAGSKEDGVLLKAVEQNKTEMEKHGYRTVGEMLFSDERYKKNHKRNKGENYLNTVSRDMVEDELRKIFTQQREKGNTSCSQALEDAYLKILLSQRSFEEGPGSGPYAGNQIEKMLGNCTFELEEKRAAKSSYSFEHFELLQKISHIRLDIDGKTMPLTGEQRLKLIELAHSVEKLNFLRIRKELGIPENASFNSVRKHEKDVEKAEKKEELNCLKAYHQMRRALDKVKKGRIHDLSVKERNEIGRIFSLYKNDERLRDELAQAGIEQLDINALLENLGSFSKFGHLSVKALDNIIPFLEEGCNYNMACEKAGYDFKGHASAKKRSTIDLKHLAEEAENKVTSPVAKRVVSQCAKVINALIRDEMKGESPVYINIELAREMSKDHKERVEMDKGMRENAAHNERLKEKIKEYNRPNPTGLDIVKLKLYEQQGGICLYSQSQLDITRLFEPGYADIDHIVPYSISFDDSYKNKVLVRSDENRQKGNKLPLQYLSGEQRDKFTVWINNTHLPPAKKRLLLKEEITEEDREGFKERNLQDTKTMTSFIYNYLSDHLAFAPFSSERKRYVTAVNGSVTSMLRGRWGLTKVRADGDTHHAVDAAVIACTTQGMVNKFSGYYRRKEQLFTDKDGKEYEVSKKTGELKERFPEPFENFSGKLMAKLSDVFVSRMPSRKVGGAAHKETIKGVGDDNTAIKKVALTSLKLDKNNEIENYHNPNDDRLLYNALRQRLIDFDGNAADAFKDPFYKPKSDKPKDDEQPPSLVKKVKICEKNTLNVPVHKGRGVADNDSMVRVDVFHIEGDGYYLVPIYVADTLKDTLPNKAIVAAKPYSDWKEMSDDNFAFSLYPNDLIYVKSKKPMTFSKVRKESKLADKMEQDGAFVYYKGTGIAGGQMTVIYHDNSYTIQSLGSKTLQVFEKYQVDVLGNISKVGREKRQGFTRREA